MGDNALEKEIGEATTTSIKRCCSRMWKIVLKSLKKVMKI